MIAKQKRLLYQLIIGIVLIGCAYAMPFLLRHTELVVLIVATLLTAGVILLVLSVKAVVKKR